jgi:hypothetical protein
MCPFVLSDDELLWGGFIVDLNAQEMPPVFERLHLKAKVTAHVKTRQPCMKPGMSAEPL